jgi:hypothetical protein
MKKLVEIPMGSLDDVFAWHASQVKRFENLKKKYSDDQMALKLPKWYANKIKVVQRKIDFHQSIATVVDAAIMSEIRTQYATSL